MILMGLVAAGLLCSVFISARRIQNERAHRRIDIVVDYGDLRRITPVTGEGMVRALRRISESGATAIAIYEDNFIDALDNQWIALNRMPGASVRSEQYREVRTGQITALSVLDRAPRIMGMFRRYFGEDACPESNKCFVPFKRKELEEFSLGFSPPQTDLAISLRPRHVPFDTPESIRAKMQAWDRLERKGPVIFDGIAVTGYPNGMKPLLEEIGKRPGMRVGYLELAGQQGMTAIAAKYPEQIVQTHGITDLEMLKVGRETAVRRMVRAVRERRVQVLYLRLFVRESGLPPQEALDFNADYVKAVADGVRAAGYEVGSASPVKNIDVPWVIRAGAVSGAFALVFLLAGAVFRAPWPLAALACLLVFPGYPIAASQGMGMLVLKASALLVGCLAPGLAVSALFLYPQKHYDGPGRTMPLSENVRAFLAVSLLTAAAGFMAGSILSHRDLFARIETFAGVKLALVFPMLVVIYAWLRVCRFSLREFLESPLRYVEALAGVAILGAAAIYLMRSGNDAALAPMGGQERNVREWLEAVFVARPRTKEFLFGHPAMILLGLIPFHRRNYLFLVVLLAGVVGQASLFNTFCHIHTPLPLTLARVALGVILGTAVGAALRTAWIAAMRIWRRE
jgi:hypothetical protein